MNSLASQRDIDRDEVRFPQEAIQASVFNAERTFWEKATILHQYAHLPETKALPDRISRHFYDFYRLLNSEVKAKALADMFFKYYV